MAKVNKDDLKIGVTFTPCKECDRVEIVHSMWIFNKDGSGTCRHCHRTTRNAWDYDNWFRYCPSCGALMDGDRYE